MDPVTILAVLGPLAVDLGKSLISRFVAPDEMKPANIDEYIKMRQCDVEMFKLMNDAGSGSATYPWVEAVIKLQRPAVVTVTFMVWGWLKLTGATPDPALENFCAAVGFYLFGDRTLFYAKGTVKK